MYPVVLHCPQRYGDKYTSQAMTIMKRGTRRIFHALTMADLLATVKEASKGKAKHLSQGVADAAAAVAALPEPTPEALAKVLKAIILQDKEKVLEMRAKQAEEHEALRVSPWSPSAACLQLASPSQGRDCPKAHLAPTAFPHRRPHPLGRARRAPAQRRQSRKSQQRAPPTSRSRARRSAT